MNKQETTTQTAATANAIEQAKAITLPSGKIAVITKGKGKHAMRAMEIAGGKGSMYLPALMAQLVTIDGAQLVAEDLAEMPLTDYMTLQTEFAEQNF